jgi:hypothetical protein
MARAVTTLDEQGIITEPIRKLDKLLKVFFASDELQSSLTPAGSVKSLPKLTLKYKPDAELREAVREALQELLRPYFDTTEVSVNITSHADVQSNYDIGVTVKVYQDGNAYDSVEIRTVKDSFIDIFG